MASLDPDPPSSSPQYLAERAMKAHFAACPAIEVRRRGSGFLVGRYLGPIVFVETNASCQGVEDKGVRKVRVETVWRSLNPANREEIGSLRRSKIFDQPECPRDYSKRAVLAPFVKANLRVCQEAFTPMRDPHSLAAILVPILSSYGPLQLEGTDDGNETLRWVVNDRVLHLTGKAICRPITSQIEGNAILGPDLMSWVLELDLRLEDKVHNQRLGQWKEIFVQGIGIECGRPIGTSQRRSDANEAWEQKITEAVEQAELAPSSSDAEGGWSRWPSSSPSSSSSSSSPSSP